MLSVGGQRGVRCRTRPQRKTVVVFGCEHDVFCPGIVQGLGPRVRVPLLDLLVKKGSKAVVVVVGSVMLAMIRLRGRSSEPHAVEIPLRIRIVGDVILRSEIMLGMNQRRPAGDRVESPVNEYSQLRAGIPPRKRMFIQRFKGRFVVRGLLRLKIERNEKGSKQRADCERPAAPRKKHLVLQSLHSQKSSGCSYQPVA